MARNGHRWLRLSGGRRHPWDEYKSEVLLSWGEYNKPEQTRSLSSPQQANKAKQSYLIKRNPENLFPPAAMSSSFSPGVSMGKRSTHDWNIDPKPVAHLRVAEETSVQLPALEVSRHHHACITHHMDAVAPLPTLSLPRGCARSAAKPLLMNAV